MKTARPNPPAPLPLADAYLPWARATQFRDAGGAPAGQARWLSLLLELRIAAPAFFALTEHVQQRWIRVPAQYAHPPKGLEAVHFCTAIVSADMLAVLTGQVSAIAAAATATEAAALQAVCAAIVRFEIGFSTPPWPAQAAGMAAPKHAQAARSGPSVVVGVIDDGLSFANMRFCVPLANGGPGRATRFLSLWDQGGPAPARAVPGCAYGRAQGTAALNRHIAGSVDAGSGQVDEDATYQRAGYREVRHRITHGTHVLDLAAGAAGAGAATAPHIVGVQVPGKVLEDTSCASTTVFLLDALHHILAEADRAFPAAPAGPALVNISLGNIAGPHDGSSVFEAALGEVIRLRRRLDAGFHVVMPAGNSLLSRCHAQLLLPAGKARTLTWRMPPADGTPNFLELWLRPGASRALRTSPVPDLQRLTLTLTSPRGDTCTVTAGQTKALRVAGHTVAMVSLQARVANGRASMALLAVAPTQAGDGGGPSAPSGAWAVMLSLAKEADATGLNVQAYIQRDDIAFGRRSRARQSIFEDAGYRRYSPQGRVQLHDDDAAACVRRAGTFNGLATAAEVDVAGGAVHGGPANRPLAAAPYSSVEAPGLTAKAGSKRTHQTAVTEDSAVLHGVLAAGTRSGSVVALSGTSMAAPQLLRSLWAGAAGSPGGPGVGQAIDADRRLRPLVPASAEVKRRAARRRGGAGLTSAEAGSG